MASLTPHAVLIPEPAQGHVTPLLQLAKLLHLRGFHITFVHSEYNHRRILRSQGPDSLDGVAGFHFEAIPDGIPPSDDDDVTQDIAQLCLSQAKHAVVPFRELLQRLNASEKSPPVSCVVADGVMTFAQRVAEEMGIPAVVFWTTSACGFMGYLHFAELIKRGYVPLKANFFDDQEEIDYFKLASMTLTSSKGIRAEIFLSSAEKFNIDAPLLDITDKNNEASLNSVLFSETDRSIVAEKGSEIKVKSKLATMLRSPSSTPFSMSANVTRTGREELRGIISLPPAASSQNAEEAIKHWAEHNNRFLTAPLLKALVAVLINNKNLKYESLDFVILGWDLRGEHNVNEVKTVIDAQQQALNDIITTQRGIKDNMKNILDGMERAYTKLTGLTDRNIPISSPVPLSPAQITKTVSQSTGLPMLPNLVRRQTNQTVPSYEERNVQHLLDFVKKDRSYFARFIPDTKIDSVLQAFLNNMSSDDWKAMWDPNGRAKILERFMAYISAVVSKLKEMYQRDPAKGKATAT